jgi:DNA gyrase inhibitor GyrI
VSVKNTLGQNYQMFVTMRAKKTSWDKTAIFLSVWRQKKTKTTKEQRIYDTILFISLLLSIILLK